MSNRNIALKWLLIAALTIICVAQMKPTPMYAQRPIPVYFKDSLPDGDLGMTFCDAGGKPVIFLLAGMNGTLFRLVLMHELRHVRQLQNHEGGCVKAMKHYRDDAYYRFESEMEAYAVQFWADSSVSPLLKAAVLAEDIWAKMEKYHFPKDLSHEDVQDYAMARYGSNAPP